MDAIAATRRAGGRRSDGHGHPGRGRARAFASRHQVKILTDDAFTRRASRPSSLDPPRTVDRGEIAVVAGFQGADSAGNITTLGRAGRTPARSPWAAAIGADECEIYTDVDGVYTTDPNVCPSARKIDRISTRRCWELDSAGAKVLQNPQRGNRHEVRRARARPQLLQRQRGTLVTKEDAALGASSSRRRLRQRRAARARRGRPRTSRAVAASFSASPRRTSRSTCRAERHHAADPHASITFTGQDDLARPSLDRRVAKASAARGALRRGVVKVSIVGFGNAIATRGSRQDVRISPTSASHSGHATARSRSPGLVARSTPSSPSRPARRFGLGRRPLKPAGGLLGCVDVASISIPDVTPRP